MITELVPGITADPDIAFGKPVVAGTRTPAALILGQLAGGVSMDEVCAEYELTREQVLAVLRYAASLAGQETVQVRAS